MKLIVKYSSLFTSLIAVFLVASLENSYNRHNGLPSNQINPITLKAEVPARSFQEFQKYEPLYDKNLKKRIIHLVSSYKTGLNNSRFESLSERIIYESKKYGYDPLFLAAIIITESSFYNWARSNKGAIGLMQIRPATGKELASETHVQWKGKPTLLNPEINIALGAYYLNKLILRFGDLGLALEAYNHGPSRLSRYLKKGYRPKSYSQKVFRHYSWLRSQSI